VIDKYAMLQVVNKFVGSCSSEEEAAERLGITLPHLHDVLAIRLPISDEIARKLGYARATWYQLIGPEGT
jgi:hypothetical protein